MKALAPLVVALALIAPAALAQIAAPPPGPSASGPRASVHLLDGWREADGRRMAGLRIALAPGWKTYWRVPGEAGVAPFFDWSGSENVASVTVRWPRPETFETYGYASFGYHDEVTLPLDVRAEDASRPVRLRLTLDFGVCEEICVPERAELSRLIAAQARGDEAAIAAALRRAPSSAAEAGLEVVRCTLAGAGDARRFEGAFRLAAADALPDAVVEGPANVWFLHAEVRRERGTVLVEAPLDRASRAGWADRSGLRVTLLGPEAAVEIVGCAE